MEHWTDTFEHESLKTLDDQQSFKKAMGKYGSEKEAVVGGYNAIKEVGKPYKLPESLDKLPSDESRTEFKTRATKLLGAIEKPEDLADINWTKGLPVDAEIDEKLVERVSKFAASQHFTRDQVQEMAFLNNTIFQEIRDTELAELKQIVDSTRSTLKNYFGEPAFAENVELMKRAFANNAKLTAEEYKSIAEFFTENGMFFKNPVFAKALINLTAPLGREGKTETTTTTKGPEKKADLPGLRSAVGLK